MGLPCEVHGLCYTHSSFQIRHHILLERKLGLGIPAFKNGCVALEVTFLALLCQTSQTKGFCFPCLDGTGTWQYMNETFEYHPRRVWEGLFREEEERKEKIEKIHSTLRSGLCCCESFIAIPIQGLVIGQCFFSFINPADNWTYLYSSWCSC